MHRAIECVGDTERLPPGNRDPDTPRHALIAGDARLDGATAKCHEVGDLAPVQRQFKDALILDHLAHARGSRFDHRGVRLNRNGLGELADLQDGADDRVGIDLQHDACLRECAESGQRDFQAIGPDRQVGQDERAGRIANRRPHDPGAGVGHGHVRAGQDATGLIFDATADLGCRLGPDIGAGKKQDEQAAGEPNENARHIAPFVSADWDQMSQSRMAENPLIFQRNAAMLARRPPSVKEGMTQRLAGTIDIHAAMTTDDRDA